MKNDKKSCSHCGACPVCDRCDHCGCCRKCGRYVAPPVPAYSPIWVIPTYPAPPIQPYVVPTWPTYTVTCGSNQIDWNAGSTYTLNS